MIDKDKLFRQIVEEAKREVIDPIISLLYFEFNVLKGIPHVKYVEAITERYKYSSKVMKQIEPYLELWKSELE